MGVSSWGRTLGAEDLVHRLEVQCQIKIMRQLKHNPFYLSEHDLLNSICLLPSYISFSYFLMLHRLLWQINRVLLSTCRNMTSSICLLLWCRSAAHFPICLCFMALYCCQMYIYGAYTAVCPVRFSSIMPGCGLLLSDSEVLRHVDCHIFPY